MSQSQFNAKSITINGAKLLFSSALVYYMVISGSLDFNKLRVFLVRPDVFILNICLWVFVAIGLSAYRWFVLLRGLDIGVKYVRCVGLHLIGIFFNTVMPGAVGGDIIKSVYVIKEQKGSRKTPAILSILLDRVMGVVALFTIAGIALLLSFGQIWQINDLHEIVLFILFCLCLLILGFAVIFFPFKKRDPILALFDRKIPGFKILQGVYTAMRSFRERPGVLIKAWIISILIQTCYMGYYWYITAVLTGVEAPFSVLATILPLGIITTAFPVTPGGLGLGHVAFEQLFKLSGLTGGANIFNVVFLGQMSLNLLGSISFFFFRMNLPGVKAVNTTEL